MSISIDQPIANAFGLEAAYIVGVIRKSAAAKALHPEKYEDHFHGGFYWMFATYKEWSEKYPFLGSEKSVQRRLTELVESGVLIQNRFNRKKYDKTNWYRLNDKSPYFSSNSDKKRLDKNEKATGQNNQSDWSKKEKRLDNLSEATGQIDQTYTSIHLTDSSFIDHQSSFPALQDDDFLKKTIQEPKPIRVPRNQRDFEEPLYPETEPKVLTPIQQMAAKLIALGVDQITAESLVINHKEIVRNQLDWLPHRNAKSPAGYIVQAIKGNYEPPKHIAEELKAKAESEAHAARIQAQKEAWEKAEKERLEAEKKRQAEHLAWWESLSDEQKTEHKRKQQEALELQKQQQIQAMSEAKKKILAAKVNAEKWQLNRFNQNNQAVGG